MNEQISPSSTSSDELHRLLRELMQSILDPSATISRCRERSDEVRRRLSLYQSPPRSTLADGVVFDRIGPGKGLLSLRRAKPYCMVLHRDGGFVAERHVSCAARKLRQAMRIDLTHQRHFLHGEGFFLRSVGLSSDGTPAVYLTCDLILSSRRNEFQREQVQDLIQQAVNSNPELNDSSGACLVVPEVRVLIVDTCSDGFNPHSELFYQPWLKNLMSTDCCASESEEPEMPLKIVKSEGSSR